MIASLFVDGLRLDRRMRLANAARMRLTGTAPVRLVGTALALHLVVAVPAAVLPAGLDHTATATRVVVDVVVAVLLAATIAALRGAGAPPASDDLLSALVALRAAQNRYAERDHELRNGLAGLAGVTRLLEMPARAEREASAREERALLHSAVTAELSRLGALLDDPAEPTSPAVFAVEPVLRSQVRIARSAGLDVELDTGPDLRATGLDTALTQVIANLLANCARHAPGSPVRVTAAGHRDRVRITVSDRGPGIPPDARERIFDRGTGDPRSGGAGLGLHISRRLLAAQDGCLSVALSAPGRGTTMVVDLPAAREPAPGAR